MLAPQLMDSGCDLLLFVATTTELQELRAAAQDRGLRFDRIEQGKSSDDESYYLGELGSYRTIAVKTRMGALGYGGSAASGLRHMGRTGASSVICLGMAFGIDRRYQSFGDVLVSTAVFPYDRREVVIDGEVWKYQYPEEATAYKANPELLRIMDRYRERVVGYRVLPGCVLTGSALVQSEAYRNNLVRWSSHIAPTIIGGEMEGVGLLALSPKRKPKWAIVKGICDFADGRQEQDAEAHRGLACRNASAFVLDALKAWTPDAENTRKAS